MKKFLYLFGLLAAVIIFSACTITSPTTSTTSISSTTSSLMPWIGEWKMISEVSEFASGEITNPATNKTIQFEDNGNVIEDYSELEGLGICTETKGRYTSTWTDQGDNKIAVDVPGSVEEVEPYIDCGPGAGTTAVPRSIAHFSYTGESWNIMYNEGDDTLTATLSGPPGQIIQKFERQ